MVAYGELIWFKILPRWVLSKQQMLMARAGEGSATQETDIDNQG